MLELKTAMTRLLRVVAGLLVVGAALGVSGCGGGGSPSPPPPGGQAPVIQSFTASPSWVTAGGGTTLKWSVTAADSVSLSPGATIAGSSAQVTPATDTTYVLTASNAFGSTQAQVSLPVFPPPTMWFAPIGATPAIPQVQGATDYFDLFSQAAPWSMAASHVTVFKMYAGMLDLDDATLRNMFADLKRRHIAFAIEWGPLDEPNRCGIGEGFDGTLALHYAQRIRDLGASLQYIAFDEPYDGAALYQGTNACYWTPEQIAQNAAKNVAQIQSIFPDVVVGDIESLPNGPAWLEGYEQWVDAWQAVTGKPLAFFHFDVDWTADWKPAAAALTRALNARHIPAGHIYNGGDGASDAAWIGLAEEHMADYETHAGLIPDEVIFQSWHPYPKHLLPENDPTSFTWLIDRYFRERSALALSSTAAAGQGTLTANSAPLPSAAITLTEVPLSGTGQPGVYTQSGNVPAGTQYLVFGARVALENCSSVSLPAEFYLTDFTLDAGAAGQVHADFTSQLNGWAIWGNAAIAQVEQSNLHVQVMSGETMALNSGSLPFTAAGAAYTFTVHAMIPVGSRGDGCVIAVFQDGSFQELSRAVMQIVPLPMALPPLQTDANGAFAFNLAPQPAPFELWADYGGTGALWPAAAAVGIGAPPPLAITTSTLPDGAVGSNYSQALTASGGRTPYLWAAGPLPPGLILHQDGTLSGNPTVAGTWTISASVVDDSDPAQVADLSLQLTVQ
jgi:hypothetical protein